MADDRYVVIRFHFDLKLTSFEALGWPELKESTDAIVKALGAMPGGPVPRRVLPVGASDGSLVQEVRIPRDGMAAYRTLRSGPNRRWTADMLRGVEDLVSVAEKHGGTVKVGIRGYGPAIRRPAKVPDLVIVGPGTLRATVTLVGGERGRVHLRPMDGGPLVVASASSALLPQLGARIHRNVLAVGTLTRVAATGEIKDFEVTGFEPLGKPLSVGDTVHALRALVGRGGDVRGGDE